MSLLSNTNAQGGVENDWGVTAEGVGDRERQRLEREIDMEITKLAFYSDQTDDLIQDNNTEEIKIVSERMESIQSKIIALCSQIQELKISEGETSREVRQ